MPGFVDGYPKLVLRVEGVLLLIAALYFYDYFDYSWSTFAIFFLLPDVSFLGYLAGNKIGAIVYNFAHSSIGAIICIILSQLLSMELFLIVGLIWTAHIGFDRALGYGLKYAAGFAQTHLGIIGKHKI